MKTYDVLIPARGGSKSIPLKNIKPIAGKPLIYWSLDAAVKCDKIKKVYVSTDSDRIRRCVLKYGSSKVLCIDRSEESATDTASTEMVIEDFIKKSKPPGNIVLLQATSPLVTAEDLSNAINTFEDVQSDTLLSVVKQKRFYWDFDESNNNCIKPLNYEPQKRPRRQDFNGTFVENGAIYIFNSNEFLKHKSRLYGNISYIEMDEKTYYELDEPADWLIVENFIKSNKRDNKEKSNIKLFVSDVDGVLTDSGMYYSEKGDELKKFNTRDGMGFELLRKAGIKTAIITSEDTKIVERRAKKLKIDYLIQGCKDKLTACQSICEELGISLDDVAFIGDDINDKEILINVGYPACPKDCNSSIINSNTKVLNKCGGEGVVREFVETILSHMIN